MSNWPSGLPNLHGLLDGRLDEKLAAVRGVMFDIDGCLVLSDAPAGRGGHLLPGAPEAIRYVRSSGRRLCIFTNGTADASSIVAARLRDMGLEVGNDEVLTPAAVAAELMAARYPGEPILVFGGDGMRHDFQTRSVPVVGHTTALLSRPPRVPAVVIGWDDHFGLDQLKLAAAAVNAGAKLYCTSDAPAFASSAGPNVGVSGFIAAGLRHVTGQPYEVVGKPSMYAMKLVARTLQCPADSVLVVGDDLNMEAAMARRAAAIGAIVLTGSTRPDDVSLATELNTPDIVVSSLFALVEQLQSADLNQRLAG